MTRICHPVSRSVTRHISIQNVTANTFNLSESKDNGDGKSIFAFKSIHSSHEASSNCQAWNICTGAAPDTDRAGAEDDDDLESVSAAVRDKTVTRVASDELASRTDEAGNGTEDPRTGHPHPGAGGNLET